jgi:hypothetical protein
MTTQALNMPILGLDRIYVSSMAHYNILRLLTSQSPTLHLRRLLRLRLLLRPPGMRT